MDEAKLERLAEFGLDDLFPTDQPRERPVEQLRVIAAYCRDRCMTTGDARYCSVGETIGFIVEFFDDYGAMEIQTMRGLSHALKRHLGDALRAETAETGVLLARNLQDEVLASLRDDRPRPGRWCMKWPPRDLFPFKQELTLLSSQPH